MVKVSIVIPVYNIEEFLPKCLDSIILQTFADFEVIMINDGSTDRSEQICKIYCDNDNRFAFYSIKNQGVSHARNLGIRYASGEFITFVDGDDWLENTFLEYLISEIDNNNADISVCSYNKCLERIDIIPVPICNNNTSLTGIDSLNMICDDIYPWVGWAWGKLYKTTLINDNDIRFDENISLNEDSLFNVQVLEKANCVILLANRLYNYRIRSNSATRSSKLNPDKLYTKIDSFEKIKKIARKYHNSIFLERVNKTLFTTRLYYLTIFNKYNKYCREITKNTVLQMRQLEDNKIYKSLSFATRLKWAILKSNGYIYYVFSRKFF